MLAYVTKEIYQEDPHNILLGLEIAISWLELTDGRLEEEDTGYLIVIVLNLLAPDHHVHSLVPRGLVLEGVDH